MAFTTGTATDYHDLLDKFRLWITGTVGWTELNWVAPTPGDLTSVATLQLSGPGGGADKRVYINIRSETNVAGDSFGWRMRAATGYVGGTTVEGTEPGESPAVYFNIWDQSITYWFYGNARRFIVVAKVSSTYVSCYMGFFLPWATPQQYPFPLYVGGDYNKLTPWTDANTGRRFFVEPGSDIGLQTAGGWVRRPDSVWLPNHGAQFSDAVDHSTAATPASHAHITPWHTGFPRASGTNYVAIQLNAASQASTTAGMLNNILPTAQGERVVIPCNIIDVRGPALGVLDGVYCPLGTGLSAEQIVTANGMTLRAFQNIHRNSGNDFILIEEI